MRLKMGPKLIADDIAHDSSMPSVCISLKQEGVKSDLCLQ